MTAGASLSWSPFTAASGGLLLFTVRSGGCYHFTQKRAPAPSTGTPAHSAQHQRQRPAPSGTQRPAPCLHHAHPISTALPARTGAAHGQRPAPAPCLHHVRSQLTAPAIHILGDNLPLEGNFQSRITNRMGVRENRPAFATLLAASHLYVYIYVYKYVLLCLYANGLKDRTLQPPRRRRSKSSVFLSGDAAPDEPSFGILRTMFDCGQAF